MTQARVATGTAPTPTAGRAGAESGPGRRWLARARTPVGAALAVGLICAAWAALAIPARATVGARTTADEPQYLLTALSIFHDHDLRIDDELADGDQRPFHEADLPVQTAVLDDGSQLSPHDPLLPLLLALPAGLGGWVAAKATLAALGGVLAGLLVWTAHRRFAVPLRAAVVTVLAFGVAAPLTAYATQVYPELPAALAVTVAIAALTGRRGPAALVVAGAAATALPWLGVKYAPVAVALVVVAVAALAGDRRRRAAAWLVVGLAAAGVLYLVAHRALYGGWTVYATGDHFTGGELTVMGQDPDRWGRSRRLAGLLLDRGFGLAAWMPGYLLAVPALAVLCRRRPPGWAALVLPLGAGWATATWVALTMHGWWWPGRQVVVVVPCLVLAVAWWVGRSPRLLPWVATAGAVGAVLWGWLVVEVLGRRRTLIVDFESTADPLYRAWRAALPDFRTPSARDWLLVAGWVVALGLGAAVALRADRRTSPGAAAP